MVNGGKKFFDIAFQTKRKVSIILANFSGEAFKSQNRFMSSFEVAARIRIVNETFVKKRIQNSVNRMMDNPVPHTGFMNMSQLWIFDIEGCII